MRTDPPRIRHHYLARHLLQHFAASDGLVRVYDRRQRWVERRDIPERLAVEKHLYSPESAMEPGMDPKDDSVERWLAEEIDGPASQPLRELVGGARLGDLSDGSRHALADFIALLDLRTPAIRDLLVPAFEVEAAKSIGANKLTQKNLRKRGVHVSLGEVRRIAKDQARTLPAGMAKPAWLNYLRETRTIARINVKARTWTIVEATDRTEFITSDLGIAKSLLGPTEPAPWEPGTILGRAHWIVPISPRLAIAITPPNAPLPEASSQLVVATNQQLARDARRYVYAHSCLDSEFFAVAPEVAGTSGTRPPYDR